MDPLDAHDELDAVVDLVAGAAKEYLATLDDLPVRLPDGEAARTAFTSTFPEQGLGSLAPLRELTETGFKAATHSAGPRFFHFVVGGGTPAALGADWLTSLLDQNAGLWPSSPFGSHLEMITVKWLIELFGLPSSWDGILTPSATYANFAALAAARHWWAAQHDVDVDATGLQGLPPMPVLSSGYVHLSVRKALGMLGLGQRSVQVFARDTAGRVDLEAMEGALRGLDGGPAVIVGNAGEVNAGDFDPIEQLADLADRYGAWLHIDGAFGLFARCAPEAAGLAAGVERAHSVISDGHKWLNVPYDAGFCFVRDMSTLGRAFAASGAAYLPSVDDPKRNYVFFGPDSSRRARALAIWATLQAYGRAGYRAMIERHLRLARRLGERVQAEPDLELLADVQLNIVCFRYRPDGTADGELDALNARLGEAVIEDGRVFFGTTIYEGRTAFRPAIVNWRTTERDVDALIDVVLELGPKVL